MGLGFPAHQLDKSRRQINPFDQLVTHSPAGAFGLFAGIVNNQRHAGRGVVEQVLLAEPVIAQIVAMIR